MRLSASKPETAMSYEIYLDGVKVENAFLADDVAGTVHRYASDKAGDIILVSGKPQIEILHGKVEFRKING